MYSERFRLNVNRSGQPSIVRVDWAAIGNGGIQVISIEGVPWHRLSARLRDEAAAACRQRMGEVGEHANEPV